MEMQQILEMLVEMRADRKADQEKADANRQADRELLIEIMDANAKSMREDVKSGEEKMEAAIHSIRSELEETIQHEMKGVLSYVDQKKQNLRMELTERIEKTHIELQTVELSLDKRTRDVEEEIASIMEDITSNKRKFQSQLEEVKAVAERGSSSATNIQWKYIVESIPAPV
jgi:hypothetical protein